MSIRRKPGDEIDGWVLDRFLGKGGNGEVWVATRNGEQAALKLLKQEFQEPTHPRFKRFKDDAKSVYEMA
jgi:hypothetical protein